MSGDQNPTPEANHNSGLILAFKPSICSWRDSQAAGQGD